MTPAQRRALQRLERRVREVAPDIATALLKAVARLTENVPITTIERALTTGGVEAVIAEVYSDATLDGVMAPARAELLRAVEQSGNATFRSAIPGGAVGVSFDVLAPQVLTAVEGLATRALGQFRRDIQDAIRAEARAGLIAGENPRTTARRIRDAVGLAPNQQQAVADFRAALEGGPRAPVLKKALDYELRDRRFDAAIKAARKSGERLTAGQIDRMVSRYRDRYVAFHAETIARTTALESLKLGQQLAFSQAADCGVAQSRTDGKDVGHDHGRAGASRARGYERDDPTVQPTVGRAGRGIAGLPRTEFVQLQVRRDVPLTPPHGDGRRVGASRGRTPPLTDPWRVTRYADSGI